MNYSFQIWLPDLLTAEWPDHVTDQELSAIQELIDHVTETKLKAVLWDWQNVDCCPTDIVPLLYPPESRPALLIDEADQGLSRLATALVEWTECKRLEAALVESSSSTT